MGEKGKDHRFFFFFLPSLSQLMNSKVQKFNFEEYYIAFDELAVNPSYQTTEIDSLLTTMHIQVKQLKETHEKLVSFHILHQVWSMAQVILMELVAFTISEDSCNQVDLKLFTPPAPYNYIRISSDNHSKSNKATIPKFNLLLLVFSSLLLCCFSSYNGKFWVSSCLCHSGPDQYGGTKFGNSLHCRRLQWLDNGG